MARLATSKQKEKGALIVAHATRLKEIVGIRPAHNALLSTGDRYDLEPGLWETFPTISRLSTYFGAEFPE